MSDLIPIEELSIRSVWSVSDIEHKAREGGQHFGMPSVMRAEHLPTGVVVYIANRDSQYRQRKVALDAIEFIISHPDFRGA